MHDSGALSWREIVDKHHFALVDELTSNIDSERQEAVSQAVARERSQRTSQVESLNQVLRRLRNASETELPRLLAEGCSAYARQLVVLVFETNQARAAASYGVTPGDVSFEIALAPAIVAAIESRDPVVALASESEISPVLAQLFEAAGPDAGTRKAYLFPVLARHSVMAMLVASEDAVCPQIELLCEAAGMRLESPGPAPRPEAQPAESAGIATPQGAPSAATAWESLLPDEQKLHLQAQRMARLRVAEMRLYHEKELRNGAAASDIYSALQHQIDSAREQFLQSFLSKSSTMVDYLHLEILRSLAGDDDRLLGHNYPGPMV